MMSINGCIQPMQSVSTYESTLRKSHPTNSTKLSLHELVHEIDLQLFSQAPTPNLAPLETPKYRNHCNSNKSIAQSSGSYDTLIIDLANLLSPQSTTIPLNNQNHSRLPIIPFDSNDLEPMESVDTEPYAI